MFSAGIKIAESNQKFEKLKTNEKDPNNCKKASTDFSDSTLFQAKMTKTIYNDKKNDKDKNKKNDQNMKALRLKI